jgi:hypothetical protein
MTLQNNGNVGFDVEADGGKWSIGSTVRRFLRLISGDVTIEGSGSSNVITFPAKHSDLAVGFGFVGCRLTERTVAGTADAGVSGRCV